MWSELVRKVALDYEVSSSNSRYSAAMQIRYKVIISFYVRFANDSFSTWAELVTILPNLASRIILEAVQLAEGILLY